LGSWEELAAVAYEGFAVDDAWAEAEADKDVPTAFAAFWNAVNESDVPSAPGFTANTIPLPQWLAGVSSPCRQYTQIGRVYDTSDKLAARNLQLDRYVHRSQ
jgi:hypothetical protein